MLTRSKKIYIGVFVGICVLGAIVAAIILSVKKKESKISFVLSSCSSCRISVLEKLKIRTNREIKKEDIKIENLQASSINTINPQEFELEYSIPGTSEISIEDQKKRVEVVPTPRSDALVHQFQSNQSVTFETKFTTAVVGRLKIEDIEISEGSVSSVERVNANTFRLSFDDLPEQGGLFLVSLKESSDLRDTEFLHPLSELLLGKIKITPSLLKNVTQNETEVSRFLRLEFEIEFTLDIFTAPRLSDLEFLLNDKNVTDQGLNKIVRNNRFLQVILNPQNTGDLKIKIKEGSIILENGPYSKEIMLSAKVTE
jgi:hypothetical protein